MKLRNDEQLLVSSPNGGGVFLLAGGQVERLSYVDTTGMAQTPTHLLWARQSEGGNRVRRVERASWDCRALSADPLDLHDLLWHEGFVYAVSTERNAVLKLDESLRLLRLSGRKGSGVRKKKMTILVTLSRTMRQDGGSGHP